jgi:hypothetical protein
MLFLTVFTVEPLAAIAADQAAKSKFLQLDEGQRYWYLEGAIAAVSHLISTRDLQKGDCVANWYLKDRDAKRKLVENTHAKYPAEGPTTIVLSMLTQACGELLVK